MAVRVLIDADGSRAGQVDLDDETVAACYRPPDASWWRINMVTTVDGSATGSSGRSGSINDEADHRVFAALRGMADAVLVGAGTARDEGYGPADVPVVLVSRRGHVPERLRDAGPGRVLMVTLADAEALAQTRATLGAEHVITHDNEVDLARLREELDRRGLRHVLSEGGPSLYADLVAAGVLDEVCTTVVPRLVGGEHPRVSAGPDVDVALRLTGLLEEGGTLLGRWAVPR